MKKFCSIFQVFAVALLVGGSGFGLVSARAQSGVGDIVYTVGTTVTDSHNRNWAYILWQAVDPALTSNRVFAVYAKPGSATNAAPYTRLSLVRVQTDARVIEPLLQRAENLGDNLVKLQEDLSQMFGSFIPSTAISRADQLSAVIRGSLGNSQNYGDLILLGRNHAGINLCLGFADAEMIGAGLTTFEIRAIDPLTEQDQAVIGRVTVEAGNPTVLPEPGPPVLVPETSPMGDLNLKFRWGTPDNLRRLSLMQFGYDLYRVAKPYANGKGWNTTSRPLLTTLQGLAVTNPAVVRRVNRVPITPPTLLNTPDAANLAADPKTSFIMDDDGRGRPGYINYGFTNSSQFYYYVAARDVLGRAGILSTGLLATVCDRMPPLPVKGVTVVNDYQYNTMTHTSSQALRINWKQNLFTNDVVANYWIYRWTNVAQMNSLSGNIGNNLIGIVTHHPGVSTNTFLDSGSGSPSALSAYGKTFWYTVRAADMGACGPNLSGNSGPAYGVLRQRVGPAAGTGNIQINCLRPYVSVHGITYQSGIYDPTNFYLYVHCQRLDPRIVWAEFIGIATYTVAATTGPNVTIVTNDLGRLYYPGAPSVGTTWTPARTLNGKMVESVKFDVGCRAALANGKISSYAIASLNSFGSGQKADVAFDATVQSLRTTANDRQNPECVEHDPGGGGGGVSGTNDICVEITPTTGSKEYRIYRRVEAGPLTLLASGPVTNGMTTVKECDGAMPANGGSLCYYVQLLDENGNPSPMANLGCVDVAPNAPLPVPMLSKIVSSGDESSPGMKLMWFCPPYGVERFEVLVAALPSKPNTNGTQFCSQLSSTGAPPVTLVYTNGGTNLSLPFYSFVSPKVGPGFGNNGAAFQVIPNVEIGHTYYITVRALGKNGNAGNYENFEEFLWSATNAPSPQVPWPARPLPSATNANFAALVFFVSPAVTNPPLLRTPDFTGNAVWIGVKGFTRAQIYKDEKNRSATTVSEGFDPMSALGTNVLGESIMPFALYRYQVANANFPSVSGDTIQVSPLMENIAYELDVTPGVSTNTVLHDPFLTTTTTTGGGVTYLWLWAKDTQPIISGARYKYILVRFKSNHEIDQLVPSNEVDVP